MDRRVQSLHRVLRVGCLGGSKVEDGAVRLRVDKLEFQSFLTIRSRLRRELSMSAIAMSTRQLKRRQTYTEFEVFDIASQFSILFPQG